MTFALSSIDTALTRFFQSDVVMFFDLCNSFKRPLIQ